MILLRIKIKKEKNILFIYFFLGIGGEGARVSDFFYKESKS